MKRCGLILSMALVAGAAAAAVQPAELRIENAAVRLVVVPEARSDIAVTVAGGRGGAPAPKVSRQAGSTRIDGGLTDTGFNLMGLRIGGPKCEAGRVNLPGKGWVAVADLPLVTVHAPLDARLVAAGAVFGEVGATNSLALTSSGCGRWKVGPVRGAAAVRLAGSPEATMTTVAKGLTADLTGASRLTAAEASGPLAISVIGSSHVDIAHGTSQRASLLLKGSGGLVYGGEVGTLNTDVTGSGNIRVAMVFGMAMSNTRGTGAAYIGRPKGVKFCGPCN